MRQTGERWRLGRRPGLDGLRGIAILLVLANHAYVPILLWGGGAAGVGAFFTLSGFLITSLLLADQDEVGRVRFRRFYVRRALRLLPALYALVAVVLVAGLFVDGLAHRDTVLGALGYCANWLMAAGAVHPGDALGHTWSLAVEEQFYLIWPTVFVMLARRRVRVMLGVIGLVCAGALVERLWLWVPGQLDNWRIYFGLMACWSGAHSPS